VLPPWAYAGGAEEELRRLKDEKVRYSIRLNFFASIRKRSTGTV